jgi:hypothetical protein
MATVDLIGVVAVMALLGVGLLLYEIHVLQSRLHDSQRALLDAVRLVLEVDEGFAAHGSPRILTAWGLHRQRWLEAVRALRGWSV